MGAEWRTDKRESRQESKTRWKAVAVIPGRDNDDYAKRVAGWTGRSKESLWGGLTGFGGWYVGRGETSEARMSWVDDGPFTK